MHLFIHKFFYTLNIQCVFQCRARARATCNPTGTDQAI